MKLLDIHEPGQTPEPHHKKNKIVLGIDLGTTNSLVSIYNGMDYYFIPENQGKHLIPSVVSYEIEGNKVYVGSAAVEQKNNEDFVTISSIKRFMGKSYNKDIAGNTSSYNLEFIPSDKLVEIKVGEKKVNQIEVSSEILQYLKSLAESHVKEAITDVVITVPAYFDESARSATKLAAKMAGLNVLRLINEPTAAALAYGLDKKSEGIYLVYDLGGGTFDVSILNMHQGIFQVIATGGDNNLGGDDIDLIIANYIKENFAKNEELYNLISIAKDLKHEFTTQDVASIRLGNLDIVLTKQKFEELIHKVINKTMNLTLSVLKDAELSANDIKGVILVGGSTRITLIKNKLEEIFGKKIFDDVNPDEIVAVGAGLSAYNLTNPTGNLLIDIIPLSLGIEIMGGLAEKIIHRNTAIPISVTRYFSTHADNQTGMKFHLLQGEREFAKDCRSLGMFELKNIPPMRAGLPKIKVTFTLDADGLLTVEASEEVSGSTTFIEVKPSYGLDENDITAMLIESYENAYDDIQNKLIAESKIKANKMIDEIKKAISEDSDIITNEETVKIESQIKILNKLLEQNNRDDIDIATKNLEKLMIPFVERKVKKYISLHVEGKNIE